MFLQLSNCYTFTDWIVARSCIGAACCRPRGEATLLNSLASGRHIALRIVLLQLLVALLVGLVFLALGPREAVSAAAGATMVALGTALMSARFFSGVTGAGQALGRLLTGVLLKWIVIVGGLIVILFQLKLPPLAAITGLAAAYAVYLLAFRFKG
ncbi:hypothetical protein [Rhodanobacter ginsengiterrae]|uniref:hypothetical protein n=1 Tax=Rhodanobacter ginsengiterrae TaxID=2008451 RepID=UPI003CF19F75